MIEATLYLTTLGAKHETAVYRYRAENRTTIVHQAVGVLRQIDARREMIIAAFLHFAGEDSDDNVRTFQPAEWYASRDPQKEAALALPRWPNAPWRNPHDID